MNRFDKNIQAKFENEFERLILPRLVSSMALMPLDCKYFVYLRWVEMLIPNGVLHEVRASMYMLEFAFKAHTQFFLFSSLRSKLEAVHF